MNLQPSNRRQDLPVRLGTHGYRLDGDFAFLNAELHIPPYFSGSNFGLELWACSAPHAGGNPDGMKVAAVSLELPTPIGPHVHRVEARAALTPPPGNGDHAVVLMLVANAGEARRIHDFANYERLQRFANPCFDGAVGYAIEGDHVILSAQSVANPRPEGNSSGTLCLELWALSEPYAGGTPRGHRVAGAELRSVWGQYHLSGIERRSLFVQPSPGRWRVALLLREWTVVSGYVTRDYRNFDVVYEQAAPERASVRPATAVAAGQLETVVARSADKLRLIKPVAAESGVAAVTAAEATPVATPAISTAAATTPAATLATATAPAAASVGAATSVASAIPGVAVTPGATATPVGAATSVATAAPAAALAPIAALAPVIAPAAADKSRLLCVQTATVEELSKLPGLSLKVAKEIVKSRPFASLDALLDVRGIGEKTLRRIKGLITL